MAITKMDEALIKEINNATRYMQKNTLKSVYLEHNTDGEITKFKFYFEDGQEIPVDVGYIRSDFYE